MDILEEVKRILSFNEEPEKKTLDLNVESNALDRGKLKEIWESVKNKDFEKREPQNQGVSEEENQENGDFEERKGYSLSELAEEEKLLTHVERVVYGNPLRWSGEINKPESVRSIKKRKKNKLAAKAKFNIISERGTNRLNLCIQKKKNERKVLIKEITFKNKKYTVKIVGNWTHKSAMLMDLIAHKFMTQNEERYLATRQPLFFTIEEAQEALELLSEKKILKELWEEFPTVELTDSEIRRISGLPLSTREIHEIVWDMVGTVIEATFPCSKS